MSEWDDPWNLRARPPAELLSWLADRGQFLRDRSYEMTNRERAGTYRHVVRDAGDILSTLSAWCAQLVKKAESADHFVKRAEEQVQNAHEHARRYNADLQKQRQELQARIMALQAELKLEREKLATVKRDNATMWTELCKWRERGVVLEEAGPRAYHND